MGLVSEAGASVSAHVAYVVLQPASWGRFKGLNARKDVADTLTAMVGYTRSVVTPSGWPYWYHIFLGGQNDSALTCDLIRFGIHSQGIKAIRLGGSFCSVTKNNGAYYQARQPAHPGGV